ncbi:uncharacterized protein LOC131943145 [Physella acuta]|uniref:uncharacterized protein LOC131943145 n=1 Tax=Physella acuta TaxID=109671 RepID=UPI0027DCA39D|nr:uncharacterized protein LOC131943145 [Physella acuta]XP_059159144.1 uncharacterized protein LOC131943145 [Physella acuta]
MEDMKIKESTNVDEKEREETTENTSENQDSNQIPKMPLGLPPIDLQELTNMLRSPDMPAQKIMKEVADQILKRNEESESEDGSVNNGVVGMKGIFDCILEVSLLHEDSDKSDESEDEDDETINRQITCSYCNKIFGSNMSWKTHVLVAHPQQDQSVLNVKKLPNNEENKGRSDQPHRRGSRSSSKADREAKATKGHHHSKDEGNATDIPKGEENAPTSRRRSSVTKLQQKVSSLPENKTVSAEPQSCAGTESTKSSSTSDTDCNQPVDRDPAAEASSVPNQSPESGIVSTTSKHKLSDPEESLTSPKKKLRSTSSKKHHT